MQLRKRDYGIIVGILVLALICTLLTNLLQKQGGGVIIAIGGVETARYSFTQEGTYPLNGGTNILVIRDHTAWLESADCPDKLCVHRGKISKGGETIVCLPNRLTVTVYGVENDVDAIS